MQINPTSVTIALASLTSGTPGPVVNFTGWKYKEESSLPVPIKPSAFTLFFGTFGVDGISLPSEVWGFKVSQAPDGTVTGTLSFDKSKAPAGSEADLLYFSYLWPGGATVQLRCSYKGEITETLSVVLALA